MKTQKKILIYLVILAAIFFSACQNKKKKDTPSDQVLHNVNYIEEWQNQKFSMFIHWGLYSIPAGVWDGKQISGYSEQIKGHANIPKKEYHKLAKQFNPTKWNPDSVVYLAKKAGMKSIVITAKHHDGFCLFNSEYTNFDVVDATPYQKDILKELSESCKREGLKFGVYFSLIDWDYEGALPFTSVRNSDSIPEEHHQYNLNQVRELLTNYGEVSEIWFDMGAPTEEQSRELRDLVKKLQPQCLVSGRIWNDQGDFVVMGDNKKPDYKVGVPWQTPASMFDETWGYRSWQERGNPIEKAEEKLKDLLTVVSSGGNYLLNIGPKGDGSIVGFEQKVLENIGVWLNKNGEAVYGTNPTPIIPQAWGVITSRPGKLYLHVFSPKNKISIKGLNNIIDKAYVLNEKKYTITTKSTEDGLEIELSKDLFQETVIPVIVLEYNEALDYISPNAIKMNKNKEFILNTENGDSIHSYSGHDYYSTKPTLVKLTWDIENQSEKDFFADISISTSRKKSYILCVNEKKFIVPKEEMKNGEINMKINIGKLKVLKNNHITLRLEMPSNPNEDLGLNKAIITIKESK